MASAIKKLISRRTVAALTSSTKSRCISSKSPVLHDTATVPDIHKLICPAAINRPELGDEFDALKAKEKEAWTTLSNEDKIASK